MTLEVINLVDVHYIRRGKKNERCNFLETTPEQRNELFKMINENKEIFKDIEVNIVKLGLIKEEMCEDKRIKEDTLAKISILGRGKALLPSELKPEFRDKKICYCTYERDFNETIITAFHESYHFDDPFNFGKCVEKKDEIGNVINLKGYLKYYIKANLSEFYANYKVASKLSNKMKFKKGLMKKVKIEYFYFLNQKAESYARINEDLMNENQSRELIDVIFRYKFSEYFFRVMGIWRGFKKSEEFQVIQDEWDNYISQVKQDDFIAPGLYESLAKFFLDEPILSLEKKVWHKLKGYFANYHNFNLDAILK